MATDEIGALVVRLMGDASSLSKMLKTAEVEFKNTAKVVEAQSKTIEGFKTSVESYGTSIVGVAKSAAAAFATVGIGVGVLSAFRQFEQAQLGAARLSATIEMNGLAVKETMAEYTAFADQLAKVTTSGKGATYSLLQTASAMSLNAQQAQAAVKNAIALAAQTGGDPSSYIRQTGLLERGYVSRSLSMQLGMPLKQTADAAHTAQQAFDEMGNAIEPMEKDAAKAAEAHSRLAKMFKMAELQGQTTDAQLERMGRTFKGLSKDIGALVADGIKPAVSWLEKSVAWFNQLDPTVRKTAVGIATASGAILGIATIAPTVVAALGSIKAAAVSLWTLTATNPWVNLATGIAVGYAIGRVIYSLNSDVQALNKSMEDALRLGEQAAQQRQDLFKRMMGQTENMSPAEKKDFLGVQIERTTKDIEGLNRAIEETKRQAKEAGEYLTKHTRGRESYGLGTAGLAVLAEKMLPNAPLDMLTTELKVQQQALDDARKNLKGYEEALKNLSQVKIDQQLARDVTELTKRLDEQMRSFGLNGAELEIWKLKMAGATDAQLEHAKALAWTLNFFKEQQRHFEEAQQEQKRLMDVGKQMMKEIASPAEALQAKLKEIEDVFAAGGLSMEGYFKLIAKAEDDFAKATNGSRDAVRGLAADMGRLDAVLYGSAEAISRIREHNKHLSILLQPEAVRQRLRQEGENGRGLAQPNANANALALEQRVAPPGGIANDATLKAVLDVLKEIRDGDAAERRKGPLFNLRIGQ